MHVANKVLVWVLVVAALPFVYLTARDVKMHVAWGKSVADHQRRINDLAKEREQIRNGTPQQPGLLALRVQTHKLLIDRGRGWTNWAGSVSNPQTGAVALLYDAPPGEKAPPHGIAVNTILYVFDDVPAEKGGHYLGQFKVTAVDETKLGLEPVGKLTPREIERLTRASRKHWVFFDKMPADNPDVFAELRPEQIKAMIPESALPEFLKDGKPAEAGDPAERVVETKDPAGRLVERKYVRRLRDYQWLLNDASIQQTRLIDLVEANRRDKEYMESAVKDAKLHEEYCRTAIASLKTELDKLGKQRDAIVAHQKQLEAKLAEVNQWIDQQLVDNRKKASELTQLELEAGRRIDAQTRTMVQLGPSAVH